MELFKTASIGRARNYLARQRRDSRYILVPIFSAIVLLLCTLQALSQGLFDSIERPMFHAINGLPESLYGLFFAATQFGGLGSLLFWMGIAWYLINRRAALSVLFAGCFSWFVATIMKDLVNRGRPEAYPDSINLFSVVMFGGLGFPSGHATFAAACAAVLYYQLPGRYRRYLLLIVLLVGFSRMYLGAHYPLDVVGGWALGALVGSVFMLAFGVSNRGLSAARIKAVLRGKGYDITRLHFTQVDARGTQQVFIEDIEGNKYLGKIFGAQEHTADRLFKLYRFFRYKNLPGEEPYSSGRRSIELESFATMWADKAGVRVPVVVDLVWAGSSWMLIQQRIDAVPLAGHRHVKNATLIGVWEQVRRLHDANMAHRDLRAANLMVDREGKVWMVDFGFAEVLPKKHLQYMDIAELLMSMSLVAGAGRTVRTALQVIDHDKLKKVLPYMQREVFSGATAKALKQNKSLLDEVRQLLIDRLGIEDTKSREPT